jgi:hypothetical protein
MKHSDGPVIIDRWTFLNRVDLLPLLLVWELVINWLQFPLQYSKFYENLTAIYRCANAVIQKSEQIFIKSYAIFSVKKRIILKRRFLFIHVTLDLWSPSLTEKHTALPWPFKAGYMLAIAQASTTLYSFANGRAQRKPVRVDLRVQVSRSNCFEIAVERKVCFRRFFQVISVYTT